MARHGPRSGHGPTTGPRRTVALMTGDEVSELFRALPRRGVNTDTHEALFARELTDAGVPGEQAARVAGQIGAVRALQRVRDSVVPPGGLSRPQYVNAEVWMIPRAWLYAR